MKKAEELFEKHSRPIPATDNSRFFVLSKLEFEDALTEDRQQIKDMIDETIEKEEGAGHLKTCSRLVTRVLREIRSKL